MRKARGKRASDCTFEPRLNTSSSTVGYKPVNHLDATTVLDSIDGMRRDKEEKLEQMRMEAEHEKMKECTFEPTIVSKAVVRSSNPVIVRGLGRFLETREHAKALQEEKAERERSAFSVKNIHRVGGVTVTKPFKFSSSEMETAARSKQLREETKREVMRECTFHPRTSYSKNKAVIRHLLDEEI